MDSMSGQLKGSSNKGISMSQNDAQQLVNRTYDELEIGESAQYQRDCSEKDIILMAATSGDENPVHLDEGFAQGTQFGGRIAHGIWTGSLVSAAVGLHLPGPGTIYLHQNFYFKRPVMIGDSLTATVTVSEKREKNQVLLDVSVVNQKNKIVLDGTSLVIAPSEKIIVNKPEMPKISVEK
jgi:acyl dehydratase